MTILDFFLIALAGWRIAFFLTRESGPFGVMARIRGKREWCVNCASVWTMAIALLLWQAPAGQVVDVIAAGSMVGMHLHRYVGWNYGEHQ